LKEQYLSGHKKHYYAYKFDTICICKSKYESIYKTRILKKLKKLVDGIYLTEEFSLTKLHCFSVKTS